MSSWPTGIDTIKQLLAAGNLHKKSHHLSTPPPPHWPPPPDTGIQAYPAFVAWLALNGSRADVVLAFLSNLAVWGDNYGVVAAALRDAYPADDAAVAFFDFFATPPAGFEARALALLDEGLAGGDSPVFAPSASRLLHAYELSFWDALAEWL